MCATDLSRATSDADCHGPQGPSPRECVRPGPIASGFGLVALAFGTLLASCGRPAPQPGKIPITTSSSRALKVYLKARNLQENLRVSESNELYAKALQYDPYFALAHFGMAASAPSATKLFSPLHRAVQLAPATSKGEMLLIQAFDAQIHGKPEEQRQLLLTLVKAYPADERAHDALGDFYFRRQEFDQAIEEYRRATTINPAFSPPYNYLGYSYRYLGRLKEAEQAFKEYIALLPDEPNPYDSYAELLMQEGRFRESIAQYEKALDVNPSFAGSFVGIGNDHIFLGEYQEASNAFIKLRFVARNEGERRQATLWLAAVAIYQGRTAEALSQVENATEIARAGDDRVAVANDLYIMGTILLEAGRADDAQARYEASAAMIESAIAPPEVKAAFLRGHLYDQARVALSRGDVATAASRAEEFRKQVALHELPGEIRSSHELDGLVALARGEAMKAVKELSLAGGQDPRVLYELSQAQAAAGDAAASRATLQRVADYNSISFFYAFVRGKAIAALGKLPVPSSPPESPRS